jgi:hypothetical protein
MASKQEANAPLILTIAAMSGFFVLVLYFGVEAWFRNEEAIELDHQWDNNPNAWLTDLRESQRANLGGIEAAIRTVANNDGKLTPATKPSGS